jgi:hypothetical protein
MAEKRVEHIRVGTDRVSYCGASLGPEKSAFFGVDNAIRSMRTYHDVLPCHRCAQAVIALLAMVPESPPAPEALDDATRVLE